MWDRLTRPKPREGNQPQSANIFDWSFLDAIKTVDGIEISHPALFSSSLFLINLLYPILFRLTDNPVLGEIRGVKTVLNYNVCVCVCVKNTNGIQNEFIFVHDFWGIFCERNSILKMCKFKNFMKLIWYALDSHFYPKERKVSISQIGSSQKVKWDKPKVEMSFAKGFALVATTDSFPSFPFIYHLCLPHPHSAVFE